MAQRLRHTRASSTGAHLRIRRIRTFARMPALMAVYTSRNRQEPADAVTGSPAGAGSPVGRWLRPLVILVLVLVVAMLLFVEAYTNASFAPDGSVAPTQSSADGEVAVDAS
jgi:hypothetical protein